MISVEYFEIFTLKISKIVIEYVYVPRFQRTEYKNIDDNQNCEAEFRPLLMQQIK